MRIISSRLRPFLIACQFLTRIPVPLSEPPENRELGHSLLCYPLVGFLIGALLFTAAYLFDRLFNDAITAILTLSLWVLVTGALHLDGLADSVDAWVGGIGSRERTMALMKDPLCGPMAVVSLVLALLIKLYSLQTLLTWGEYTLIIILVPMLARMGILVLLLTTPYVRPQGLGEVLANHFPRRLCRYLCLTVTAILLLLLPLLTLKLLLISGILLLVLRRAMLKRLGGCTGDTIGATVELLEIGLLLAVAAHVS